MTPANPEGAAGGTDHYDTLGVATDADPGAIQAAYRSLARELHPDKVGNNPASHLAMARLNDAWQVLSNPSRRRDYDAMLAERRSNNAATRHRAPASPAPTKPVGSRREAWLEGMRTQILRLGNQAGRSATMSLSLPTGRLRPRYTEMLEPIIDHLAEDTASRIRAARALGAAPLDLGVVAALVGLRSFADQLVGRIRRHGRDSQADELDDGRAAEEMAMQAALVDRMWDVMAHEVPHDIEGELGGNPHLTRQLQPRTSPRRRRRRDR